MRSSTTSTDRRAQSRATTAPLHRTARRRASEDPRATPAAHRRASRLLDGEDRGALARRRARLPGAAPRLPMARYIARSPSTYSMRPSRLGGPAPHAAHRAPRHSARRDGESSADIQFSGTSRGTAREAAEEPAARASRLIGKPADAPYSVPPIPAVSELKCTSARNSSWRGSHRSEMAGATGFGLRCCSPQRCEGAFHTRETSAPASTTKLSHPHAKLTRFAIEKSPFDVRRKA